MFETNLPSKAFVNPCKLLCCVFLNFYQTLFIRFSVAWGRIGFMNIYTVASSLLAASNSISFIVKAKVVTQVLELELNVALSKIRVNDA